MTITCKVTGEIAQNVTCQLDEGQSIYADATKFRWKTTNVSIETRLTTPGGKADAARQEAQQGGSGFLKAALATATEVGKRALAGQSLAFQWFTPAGGSGLVALAGELPGQMRVIELDGSTGWRAESRAFVCAEAGVSYDIDFAGLNLGRRSKEGLIFEHFTGKGTLIIGGGGSLLELNPSSYGGKLQVHGGAVVGFADSVTFGVERVGALNAQTAMSAVFGGQGLNLVTLTGDGPVLLQSTLHREFESEEHHDERAANPLRDGLLGRL
ncbi:MAG TPA: AIM24 family protein [Acidimicrobiales bacterium]|nr:AIM24 family protein [Acidimicrobiales bacterium]